MTICWIPSTASIWRTPHCTKFGRHCPAPFGVTWTDLDSSSTEDLVSNCSLSPTSSPMFMDSGIGPGLWESLSYKLNCHINSFFVQLALILPPWPPSTALYLRQSWATSIVYLVNIFCLMLAFMFCQVLFLSTPSTCQVQHPMCSTSDTKVHSSVSTCYYICHFSP
jgi:hypothetical protein